jgi:hypothetical protein
MGSKLVEKPAQLGSKLAEKVTAAPGELVDDVAAAQGELGDKISPPKSVLHQAGRWTRDLGRALSPKRLMRRAAVATTLALMRRHLGVVGAGVGTLVLVGTGGYYAGRRSRRSARTGGQ